MDDHKPNTMNRAGFKRLLSRDGDPIKSDSDHHREYGEKMHPVDGEEAQLEYFVLPAVFREEICKGFNPKTVAHLLVERGMLLPEGAGERMRADRKERLPGMGNMRCYDSVRKLQLVNNLADFPKKRMLLTNAKRELRIPS